MKRSFDLFASITLLILLIAPMLLITIAIVLSSKGKALYWSDRVGQEGIMFKMPKFRTMVEGTPTIASHLLQDPDQFLSPIGKFLRRSSFDELPQLFSVIKGDMSFVGPRPILFNQYDMIKLRIKNGVDDLLPGITGWAQVNGRDQIPIEERVALDVEYSKRKSFFFDMKILYLTVLKTIKQDDISH